jgi:hypothetical protein
MAALSLLERRMGAMGKAARDVLASGAWVPQFKALESSLTDAPAVFTLEEVEEAVSGVWDDPSGMDKMKRRLSALRR